jgi:hypothetical protein
MGFECRCPKKRHFKTPRQKLNCFFQPGLGSLAVSLSFHLQRRIIFHFSVGEATKTCLTYYFYRKRMLAHSTVRIGTINFLFDSWYLMQIILVSLIINSFDMILGF